MKLRINLDLKVGRLVKFFVLSDFFLLAGWGFIDPIFSVFILQQIAGATLVTVGIAAAIYWIVKSVLQLPIANYLDRTPGEKDDFMALIAGLLLAGMAAIATAWVTLPWELYVVHSIQAVAFAMYFASWPTIFSRHLDKDKVSLDWSLDSTLAGIASGITGLLGGIVAEAFGFTAVFILGGLLSFIAAFVLISVPDLVLPRPTKREISMGDHTPADLEI